MPLVCPYPPVLVPRASEDDGVLEWDDVSRLDRATRSLTGELDGLSDLQCLARVVAALTPTAVLLAAIAGTAMVNVLAGLGAALMSVGFRILIMGSLRTAIDGQAIRVTVAQESLTRALDESNWLLGP